MNATVQLSPRLQANCCFAIVDDEPSLANLVSNMLLSNGATVEVFSNGLDLLKSKNLIQFDSVILDLSLPDIDGFEVMEKLAARAKGLFVILISGHDIEVVNAARIYGNAIGLNVHASLTKPFSRDQLFAALGLPV
jgi:DNA-binding response OmpR family regulator